MTFSVEGSLSEFGHFEQAKMVALIFGVCIVVAMASVALRPIHWMRGSDCEFYWGFETDEDSDPYYRFEACA